MHSRRKTDLSINYIYVYKYIWGEADYRHTDYMYTLQTQTYKRTTFTPVELE